MQARWITARKLCEIQGKNADERIFMPNGNWYERWQLEVQVLKAYSPQRHWYQQIEMAIVAVEMLRNTDPQEVK